MVLDNLIQDTLWDYLFVEGGGLCDYLSTFIGVKRHSLSDERNVVVREGMIREGVVKFLVKDFIVWSFKGAAIISIAYGLDSLAGIEKNYFNIHHILVYGNGSMSYLTSLQNLAYIYRWKKIRGILKPLVKGFNVAVDKVYHRIMGRHTIDW